MGLYSGKEEGLRRNGLLFGLKWPKTGILSSLYWATGCTFNKQSVAA